MFLGARSSPTLDSLYCIELLASVHNHARLLLHAPERLRYQIPRGLQNRLRNRVGLHVRFLNAFQAAEAAAATRIRASSVRRILERPGYLYFRQRIEPSIYTYNNTCVGTRHTLGTVEVICLLSDKRVHSGVLVLLCFVVRRCQCRHIPTAA